MIRGVFSIALVILLSSCHWEQSKKWGSYSRKAGERPAVAVIRTVPGNAWTPVLEDLLSRRKDVRLVNTNWSLALRVDAAEGCLTLRCIDSMGRIVFLAFKQTDRFIDRQQGVGDPKGAGNIIKELQRMLDGLFREGGGK